MLNYKQELAENLLEIMERINRSAELVNVKDSDKGLYCDFDMDTSINPEMFERISQNLLDKKLNCFYEPINFSGVYEDGDAQNKVLQRIFIAAFETKGEYDEYKKWLEESRERDHRILGAKLKMFTHADDIGQGLTLWSPKGATVRFLLEQFSQSAHMLNGYQWVYTPHIGKANLWERSGHLKFYKDSMYSAIDVDGEDYYLKPMSCPFHVNIYNSEIRSYRDLPMRLAEFAAVYRYELSGTLNGLTRVRGLTQDDAHIICTPEQIQDEIINALRFSLYILESFGLNQYTIYVSTKPNEKCIGTKEDWDDAIEVLKNSVKALSLDFEIDEGGGAFYGPKIDLKLKDVLGRLWQCSTIQYDFNLPQRFNMKYIAEDGKNHTPLMVHRALFGSIERFMALLIEHYKGEFPLWLAPVQFGIVPVSSRHNDYCTALFKELKMRGLRVEYNFRDLHMRKKIKQFELEKVLYILVVGDKEVDAAGFSVRSRKGGNLGMMDIEKLFSYIRSELDMGKPKYII